MNFFRAIPLISFVLIVPCTHGCSSATPEESPTPQVTPTPGIDNDKDGWTVAEGDCDDNLNLSYPGREEICDGIDNDCDGTVDEDSDDSGVIRYPDDDEDGYGRTADVIQLCTRQEHTNLALYPGDCDDTNPNVHPNTPELCGDGLDNDCDGTVDVVTQKAYLDRDLDGFGSSSVGKECPAGATYAFVTGDCNDLDPAVHPDAGEECHDDIDNNCDGYIGACGFIGYQFLEAGYAVVEQTTSQNAEFGWRATLKGDADLDCHRRPPCPPLWRSDPAPRGDRRMSLQVGMKSSPMPEVATSCRDEIQETSLQCLSSLVHALEPGRRPPANVWKT